ncbi:MAG: type VII secretion-associated serine protease mycosin, partial [Streptomyces sp.]
MTYSAKRATAGAARLRRWTAVPAAMAVAVTTLSVVTAAPAAADTSTQCEFPSKKYKGRPWSLQRVLLDELWNESKGAGVQVAVIDTGVDVKHPQLSAAVDAGRGKNMLPKKVK